MLQWVVLAARADRIQPQKSLSMLHPPGPPPSERGAGQCLWHRGLAREEPPFAAAVCGVGCLSPPVSPHFALALPAAVALPCSMSILPVRTRLCVTNTPGPCPNLDNAQTHAVQVPIPRRLLLIGTPYWVRCGHCSLPAEHGRSQMFAHRHPARV